MILAGGIKADMGAVRMAALDLAKNFNGLEEAYDKRQLRPEIMYELVAIWPPAPAKFELACLA